jgi:uncharacterized membrane protein
MKERKHQRNGRKNCKVETSFPTIKNYIYLCQIQKCIASPWVCFLFGGGLIYKFYPPKKFSHWWTGVNLRSALRNENTWKEGNRFIAMPLVYAGLIFAALSLVSTFTNFHLLNFSTVTTLVLMTALILFVFTNKHLDKVFDQDGNRRV